MTGRRRTTELNLLRLVPGHSPVHRLWAGTKLLAVAAVALVLSLRPEWGAIAVEGVLVLGAILVARVPPGALPRLPRWFWALLALGAVLTLRSSAKPIGHVAGIALSWGGIDAWARYTLLAVVILAGAALVSWTTPLADIAPALSRLGTPLKWLRLPVDEWAAAAALSIRCLPLLTEEIRTMAVARRLRAGADGTGQRRRGPAQEALDLLLATLAVSLRRAQEIGDAIEARGGFGVVSDEQSRPGRWDVVALAVVAGVGVAAFFA
jgi:energy-coupling factor transporter transmembrane protein EcfT